MPYESSMRISVCVAKITMQFSHKEFNKTPDSSERNQRILAFSFIPPFAKTTHFTRKLLFPLLQQANQKWIVFYR